MTSRLNQEQYDILKRCSEEQNMSAWNNYRTQQRETPILLENADLKRAVLEGAQLGGCNLKGARFEGANLLAADLRGADCRNADFQAANLWGATLSAANLEGASLIFANLENVDLRNANLQQANLKSANIAGAIVEDLELSRAIMGQIDLREESLDTANVQLATEQDRPISKEEGEVVFYLAEDIPYSDFVRLLKCMESLSLITGASAPHLNEIKFSPSREGTSAWDRGELDNMVSITVPTVFAELLPDFFPVRVLAGQASFNESESDSRRDMKDLDSDNNFQEFLACAGFTEAEQKIAFKNLKFHDIEERHLMEDLGAIANLVECRRILFHV